jgi:hypothetical protein
MNWLLVTIALGAALIVAYVLIVPPLVHLALGY